MEEDKDLKIFKLENLEVYQLATALSKTAWKIYQNLSWEIKKLPAANLLNQPTQLELISLKVMADFIIWIE